MRVTLINPPLDTVLAHGHVSPVTAYLFYNSAPLGILYIAAMLETHGYKVSAIDAAAARHDIAATVREVERLKPEVIGIGSTTVVFETT
jgi:hypothetical protein